VAAHICAAAPGGKRFDPNMSPEQRSSTENGIWLCAKCAKLIDSDEQKYTPEFLKRLKTEHENSISAQISRAGLIKKEFVEAVKVTAADLVGANFRRDSVHLLLNIQDEAVSKHNYRFINFLNSYTDKKLDNVPRPWRELIVGLPIISQDIGSESLNDLAKVANELHPYLSKELRREYHERLRPVMLGVLAEVQAFFDDLSRAGGLPLLIFPAPPITWKKRLTFGLWDSEGSYKLEDSLLQGRWYYGYPEEVMKYNINISKTWSGFLFDIISRLPDPDRQKGQLREHASPLKKYNFMELISIWCATAPQDFQPALTDIVRYPVNSSDHTVAGMYKSLKENFGKETIHPQV
jgi:hypothetical protein